MLDDFLPRLSKFLQERVGVPVQINSARRLTGGASQESWSLDAEWQEGEKVQTAGLILRRDLGGKIHQESLSREQEFRVLEAAWSSGVRAPRPRWVCNDPAVLDAPFFVMDRLPGESVGRKIVRDPSLEEARRSLPEQMAGELAKIHAIDVKRNGLQFLPKDEPGRTPAETATDRALCELHKMAEPHPVLELAARWLRKRAPSCPEKVLVHGDFRIGNLLVTPIGLEGVLDWEFAHLGDPAEDLAWPCVRSWRFGQDSKSLGGIGDRQDFISAYEKQRGQSVALQRINYWEILGNFRWAIGCIAQAQRHLSGKAHSLELASLGRRTAEMERELLELMENWEISPSSL